MKSLVCDTGPINYLIQIDAINVLTELFRPILAPLSVHQELSASAAPSKVRAWTAQTPPWFELQDPPQSLTTNFPGLSATDLQVLSLASELKSAVLIDDRAARIAARQLSLPILGTLGILELASAKHLINLPDAIDRLKRTNIRIAPELYNHILHRNGFKPN